jgi:Cu-Zn family superoxide dismutase
MVSKILTLSLLIPFAAGVAFAQAPSKSAHADIVNGQRTKIGTAEIAPTAAGLKIEVVVSELTPGDHGIHIHTVGKCEGPAFTSAGGHFNPTNSHHGIHNAQSPQPHIGDLANLTVGEDGKGKADFIVAGATLGDGPNSLLHEGGTSIVIHAKADDLMSDPSGNSGERVACGVIEK